MALLAALLLTAYASARAQGHGGPQGGGPPGKRKPGGGGPGGGAPGGFGSRGQGSFGLENGPPLRGQEPPPSGSRSTTSTLRGGLQLGPPGRWWDDESFAKGIGLQHDQQKRMDEVFKANKTPLMQNFKSLQHEESELEKLARGKTLVEAQIDAQIDRVVQARGELEKSNAHLLLEIRKEMTPDQVKKLDDHRPAGAGPEN